MKINTSTSMYNPSQQSVSGNENNGTDEPR